MPTVLRTGPYRFYFYSADQMEPPHAHIQREDYEAKFWLGTMDLDSNIGFRQVEIRRLQRLVEENRELLLRIWNEYFSQPD